jgi:hypothetical protein
MAVPVDSIINASAGAVKVIGDSILTPSLNYGIAKGEQANQALVNQYNQTGGLANMGWQSVYNQQANTAMLNNALAVKYSQPKSLFNQNPFQSSNNLMTLGLIAGAALLLIVIVLKK